MTNRFKQDLYGKIHEKKMFRHNDTEKLEELEEELDEEKIDSEEKFDEWEEKILKV